MNRPITENTLHQYCLVFCSYDRLDISGGNGQHERFCGIKTGDVFEVQGSYVNLNLKTDSSVTRMGYDLYFVPVDPRKS